MKKFEIKDFKVGDKVVVKGFGVIANKGTIKTFYEGSTNTYLGVEFDEELSYGHDLCHHPEIDCKNGYGYYILPEDVQEIIEEPYVFKVGDIVKGNNLSECYTITDEDMIEGRITKIYDAGSLKVKVLKHLSKPKEIGLEWNVDPKCFDLVRKYDEVKSKEEVKNIEVTMAEERRLTEDNIKIEIEDDRTFILIDDMLTVCVDEDNNIGMTKRHSEDDYVEEVGKALSSYRLGKHIKQTTEEIELTIKDVKVGDILVANEKSNGKYGITNKELGCKVEVVALDTTYIDVKVVEHMHSIRTGKVYDVDPIYFDMEYHKDEKTFESIVPIINENDVYFIMPNDYTAICIMNNKQIGVAVLGSSNKEHAKAISYYKALNNKI